MVAELLEKPLTEAQRIVQRLDAEFGMGPAAIAREVKLKTDTIDNIKRRRVTGNLQLTRLRRLVAALETSPAQGGEIAPQIADVMPDVTIDPADDPAAFSVNADDPTPAPAKSLKDKTADLLGSILGGTSGADAPKPRRSKAEEGEQAGLVAQLVPLGALLLVTSSTLMIRDPYKPCAPTMQEASAIAYPIIKRAVRELDARKKLSEGTEDAIIILLAMTAYGQRAIGTYKQIHAMEVERERGNNGQPNPGASGAVGGFGTTAPVADPARSAGPRSGAPVAFAAHADGNGHQSGRAAHGAGASGEERRPNPSINALLAADADGRRRLGIG